MYETLHIILICASRKSGSYLIPCLFLLCLIIRRLEVYLIQIQNVLDLDPCDIQSCYIFASARIFQNIKAKFVFELVVTLIAGG